MTAVATDEEPSEENPDQLETTESTTRGFRLVAALDAKVRVVQKGAVSGWVFVGANVDASDAEPALIVAGEPLPSTTGDLRAQSGLISAHAGFAIELFLRPEVALSADAGASFLDAYSTEQTVDGKTATFALRSVGFEPFAQLALHLYL